MRRLLFFMCIIIMGLGIFLFNVKYRVVSLEQELSLAKRDIQSSHHSIHVLKAEWEHLNNPTRLQKLAQKYLDVIPLDPTHYILLNQVPFRDDAIVSLVTDTLEEEGILKSSSNEGRG